MRRRWPIDTGGLFSVKSVGVAASVLELNTRPPDPFVGECRHFQYSGHIHLKGCTWQSAFKIFLKYYSSIFCLITWAFHDFLGREFKGTNQKYTRNNKHLQ